MYKSIFIDHQCEYFAVNILLYISIQLDYDVLEYNFFCLPCVFMLSVEQWTSGIHFAALSLIYTLHPVRIP